jgi:ABC-type bacteriocin/lantibiotic exporter with double-glycine peptidase domain
MSSDYFIHKQSSGHCGSASLRNMFQYWIGIDYGEEIFSKLTNNTLEGCESQDIIRAVDYFSKIKKIPLSARWIDRDGNLEMLASLARRGTPALACYMDSDYDDEHWAAILRVNHSVLIADTVIAGTREMPKDMFYNSWTETKNGINYNNTIIIMPK